MPNLFNDDNELWKTVTEAGYIFSENKYLEQIVLQIRKGGAEGEFGKRRFRKIYEVNAMIFIDNRFEKRGRIDTFSQELASEITEKLLEEIEKGNFDFVDEQGNLLMKEDRTPKIKSLGGAIWKKMNFLFLDLIKKPKSDLGDFGDEIVFEQYFIDHFDKLIESEKMGL